MSNDNTYQRNVNRRIAEELREADEPRNRTQAQLDHWVQSERDVEAEYRRLMRELNPTGLKIW
jgi:hypothetical protein